MGKYFSPINELCKTCWNLLELSAVIALSSGFQTTVNMIKAIKTIECYACVKFNSHSRKKYVGKKTLTGENKMSCKNIFEFRDICNSDWPIGNVSCLYWKILDLYRPEERGRCCTGAGKVTKWVPQRSH